MRESPENGPRIPDVHKLPDTNTPDLSPSDMLAKVDTETQRRQQISDLAFVFLRAFNSDLERDEFDKFFHNRQDIFSDEPLKDVLEKETAISKLTNYKDALAIARFYWDNRGNDEYVRVPTRISFGVNRATPSLGEDTNNKTLVYIYGKYGNVIEDGYHFDNIRNSAGEVHIPPDVYLHDIHKNCYEMPQKAKKSWLRRTPPPGRPRDLGKFKLEGCDNIMIAAHNRIGNSDSGFNPSTFIYNIDISANGKCAILPQADIHGGITEGYAYDQIRFSIHADGDIIQYDGSKISPQKISCNSYIQNGGEILPPTPNGVHLKYHQEFVQNGEIPSEEYFTAENVGAIGGEQTTFQQKILAGSMGINPAELGLDEKPVALPPAEEDVAEDADKDRQEHASSVQELQEVLDELLDPTTRLVRADESGNIEVRGYDITQLSSAKVTELAAYAAAAGWKILTSPEGTMLIQKKHTQPRTQD